MQLLFAGLGCPANVRLLGSVSSRCPATQFLQDLLVQLMLLQPRNLVLGALKQGLLLSELPDPSSDASPQRVAPANKRQQNLLADMRFEVLPPPVSEHPGKIKQSLS